MFTSLGKYRRRCDFRFADLKIFERFAFLKGSKLKFLSISILGLLLSTATSAAPYRCASYAGNEKYLGTLKQVAAHV